MNPYNRPNKTNIDPRTGEYLFSSLGDKYDITVLSASRYGRRSQFGDLVINCDAVLDDLEPTSGYFFQWQSEASRVQTINEQASQLKHLSSELTAKKICPESSDGDPHASLLTGITHYRIIEDPDNCDIRVLIRAIYDVTRGVKHAACQRFVFYEMCVSANEKLKIEKGELTQEELEDHYVMRFADRIEKHSFHPDPLDYLVLSLQVMYSIPLRDIPRKLFPETNPLPTSLLCQCLYTLRKDADDFTEQLNVVCRLYAIASLWKSPSKAEAIITEHLGPALEVKLKKESYPVKVMIPYLDQVEMEELFKEVESNIKTYEETLQLLCTELLDFAKDPQICESIPSFSYQFILDHSFENPLLNQFRWLVRLQHFLMFPDIKELYPLLEEVPDLFASWENDKTKQKNKEKFYLLVSEAINKTLGMPNIHISKNIGIEFVIHLSSKKNTQAFAYIENVLRTNPYTWNALEYENVVEVVLKSYLTKDLPTCKKLWMILSKENQDLALKILLKFLPQGLRPQESEVTALVLSNIDNEKLNKNDLEVILNHYSNLAVCEELISLALIRQIITLNDTKLIRPMILSNFNRLQNDIKNRILFYRQYHLQTLLGQAEINAFEQTVEKTLGVTKLDVKKILNGEIDISTEDGSKELCQRAFVIAVQRKELLMAYNLLEKHIFLNDDTKNLCLLSEAVIQNENWDLAHKIAHQKIAKKDMDTLSLAFWKGWITLFKRPARDFKGFDPKYFFEFTTSQFIQGIEEKQFSVLDKIDACIKQSPSYLSRWALSLIKIYASTQQESLHLRLRFIFNGILSHIKNSYYHIDSGSQEKVNLQETLKLLLPILSGEKIEKRCDYFLTLMSNEFYEDAASNIGLLTSIGQNDSSTPSDVLYQLINGILKNFDLFVKYANTEKFCSITQELIQRSLASDDVNNALELFKKLYSVNDLRDKLLLHSNLIQAALPDFKTNSIEELFSLIKYVGEKHFSLTFKVAIAFRTFAFNSAKGIEFISTLRSEAAEQEQKAIDAKINVIIENNFEYQIDKKNKGLSHIRNQCLINKDNIEIFLELYAQSEIQTLDSLVKVFRHFKYYKIKGKSSHLLIQICLKADRNGIFDNAPSERLECWKYILSHPNSFENLLAAIGRLAFINYKDFFAEENPAKFLTFLYNLFYNAIKQALIQFKKEKLEWNGFNMGMLCLALKKMNNICIAYEENKPQSKVEWWGHVVKVFLRDDLDPVVVRFEDCIVKAVFQFFDAIEGKELANDVLNIASEIIVENIQWISLTYKEEKSLERFEAAVKELSRYAALLPNNKAIQNVNKHYQAGLKRRQEGWTLAHTVAAFIPVLAYTLVGRLNNERDYRDAGFLLMSYTSLVFYKMIYLVEARDNFFAPSLCIRRLLKSISFATAPVVFVPRLM